ncbi:DEAD/DEAH box helicase family protein [Mesorhizobium sp. C386A]|uniref:DEAD/DEAH box helicase family protein n=1 Tax=unclassified Mesorhizobium TaxID=325217 RepID=UPI0003CEAAE5|nr:MULTISPECIES: DEAD/DEAH box helicase family protein [unclassified Mesorhizobium]ESY08869.1 hypothetical protein X752_21105 [Mesorhizobium sp. LNJC398B00]ESY31823.1 hypothetical protein X748_24115 [Mesorhizobium sp. LNJC386A00]
MNALSTTVSTAGSGEPFRSLAKFVTDECEARLRAYSAQPRDAVEHYETENDVLSGGYAYRQLFELVQNAADAILEGGEGAGRIHVEVRPNALVAANTGAPLDRDGIVALLNARSSSKRGGQIGRFGIGFKSLLKLGGRVDLVSRSIGLRFDPEACRARIRSHLGLDPKARAPGMRLAEVIEEPNPKGLEWATTVVSAAISEAATFHRLAEEFVKFPSEFVLFLPANIRLTLDVEGGATREITRTVDGENVVVTDGSSEAHWKLFETTAAISDPEAREDATHIQARDEVPLAWAVPLSPIPRAGRFWAFFPTETATLTSGILNAPWKLNSDRTNLVRGEWNTMLMAEAARLIADSMPALSTADDPGAPVSALPRKLDRQDEIAASLVNALWRLVVDRDIIPDANGRLRSARDLQRHPFDDGKALAAWTELADQDARGLFVHQSCQANSHRASLLNTFAAEVAKKATGGLNPLAAASKQKWLEALASADVERGRRLLSFVGDLVARLPLHSYEIRSAAIIPATGGRLVAANKAIICPADSAPAGYQNVLPELLQYKDVRTVLTSVFEILEMKEDSWERLLGASLSAADCDSGWANFWSNVARAPERHCRAFFDERSATEFFFRNYGGGWSKRDDLIALQPANAHGLDPHLLLDLDFHGGHRTHLPEGWLDIFPPSSADELGEPGGLNWPHLEPYLDLVENVGWRKMPSGPQRAKLGILERNRIAMPVGWRLLPSLPPLLAAKQTLDLIGSISAHKEPYEPLVYGHLTRDKYDRFTAPHPALFLLNRYGRVTLEDYVLPLKSIDKDLAIVLADAGFPEFSAVVDFREMMAVPTDLASSIKWDTGILSEPERLELWRRVSKRLVSALTGFDRFLSVWEMAAKDGFVPDRVPTAAGPRALADTFVTDDPTHIRTEEDGRVVLLSSKATALWTKAGAAMLKDSVAVTFSEQEGVPIPILDMFPELQTAILGKSRLGGVYAVWVKSLMEIAAHRKVESIVARDASGLILIDRNRFTDLGWQERFDAILRLLQGAELIEGDAERLLALLVDRRTTAARRRVRGAATVPERLLEAVGNSALALRSILPNAALQAVGGLKLTPIQLADLALAVHGPTILSRLQEVLTAEGLNPPPRWGGEPARLFVIETGFPAEFAASNRGKRDAELTVSGPLELPLLHDFQDEILEGVRTLFNSSKGRRRAVISLPTGGGKTRVAAEAIVRLILNSDGRRTALWIAQTDELCEQAVQCFRQLWVNVGTRGEDLRIVRLWGGQTNPSPPEADEAVVVIASIQTLNARFDFSGLDWLAEPGVVVIDECHHAIAPSYSKLLRWLDVQTGGEIARTTEPPVIGLSATPWRGHDDDESARLAARFDQRWFPREQATLYGKLRERGVLAKLRYAPIDYGKPIPLSETDVRHFEQYGELPEDLIKRIGIDPERNQLIIDAVLKNPAKSILLFANSVAHAQYIAARLHLAGCPAAAVSGETDRLARQHFVRRFRSEELRVMCNHSVLTTGFDAPKADMILISRPVFSPVRYMQMVGRGLRGPANGGTEACEIVTVQDNILSYQDRLAYHYCRRFFDSTHGGEESGL